jgi:hypothetical protein
MKLGKLLGNGPQKLKKKTCYKNFKITIYTENGLKIRNISIFYNSPFCGTLPSIPPNLINLL